MGAKEVLCIEIGAKGNKTRANNSRHLKSSRKMGAKEVLCIKIGAKENKTQASPRNIGQRFSSSEVQELKMGTKLTRFSNLQMTPNDKFLSSKAQELNKGAKRNRTHKEYERGRQTDSLGKEIDYSDTKWSLELRDTLTHCSRERM
jgi:hypothetical protein